jgi:hypothetical protein
LADPRILIGPHPRGDVFLRHRHIGLDKIRVFAEQRYALRFRECIREAIAEIQASLVPAFPKFDRGFASNGELDVIEGMDSNLECPQDRFQNR